jgi:tetratricopeptide (TPR) repeat protein
MRQAFNAARKRESGENAAELKAAINAGTNPTLKVTFFEIPNIPPDRPDTQAFADFLHQASGRGRVVIILDALDQLEDKSGALDLDWLPTEIPQNIRLILSTGLGRPLETLKSRGWLENSLTVTLLTLEERQRFIRSYLGQFRKELSPKLAERLATTPAAAHPLYLKAILDEMRVFGFHEHLEEHLSHYLGAATVVGLYERILERWEQDFDLNRPGMVQEAMTLLWAARRGLAEAELLDLLGDGSNPLPGAFWSPLYLAAENVLIKQTGPLLFLADKLEIICHPGLLKFANSAFRQAVQNRYLSREPVWLAAHRRLSDYFEKIRGQDHRPLDELPWQLAQAREWRRLYQLLGDPIFFASAWENNPVEVKGYWLLLKEHLSFQLPEAYHQVLENPGQYHRAASHLSRLMTDIGYLKEAQSLDVFLVEHYRRAGDLGKLAYALDRLATTNVVQGELLEAMALQQERQRLFLESQDLEGLAATLGKQAVILHLQGRLKEAMDMHKKEERLYRKLRDKPGLAVSLNNQALILKDWGKLKNAMELLKKVERFYRDLGDKSGLRKTLHNQAKVLDHLWKDEDALALLQEEERLCQELGDLASLSLCRALQGWILLCKMGRPEGLNLIKEAAQLATKHGLPKETIIIRGYLNRLGLS